jgi:hypothetical protein
MARQPRVTGEEIAALASKCSDEWQKLLNILHRLDLKLPDSKPNEGHIADILRTSRTLADIGGQLLFARVMKEREQPK